MSIVYRDPSTGEKSPYTGYPTNSQNQVVTFTSSDTTDANANSWTSVTILTSGERHKSIFAKISQMFKNVRYLYKMLGTTDFSGLGSDVSGALDNIGGIVVKGVEKTSTASQPYAVNEYLVYNKKLYRVKAAIAKNATITVGTNVDSANTNVGAELTTLKSALTNSLTDINTITGCTFSNGDIETASYIKSGKIIALRLTLHTTSQLTANTNYWLKLPDSFPGDSGFFCPLSNSFSGSLLCIFRTKDGSGKYILLQSPSNIASGTSINMGGVVFA